jgi:hypothetical protein
MTRLSVVIIATAAFFIGALLLLTYLAPLPFESVKLRDGTVVAKVRPHVHLMALRFDAHTASDVSGGQSLELHDGESMLLSAGDRDFTVKVRAASSPPGLDVKEAWHLHNIPGPAYRFFLKAQ